MREIKIFLASSGSLKDERIEIERLLARKNDSVIARNIYLRLSIWEKISAAFSESRKQDEFNNEVVKSDIFICLVYDKLGQFTFEEFCKAYASFSEKKKPERILVYFKDAPLRLSKLTDEYQAVLKLKEQIKIFEQIWVEYESVHQLLPLIDREIDLYLADTHQDDSGYVRELLSNHCILDIQDTSGQLVLFERRSHIKALRTHQIINDSYSIDGGFDLQSLATYPGTITSIRNEDNRLEIETKFENPITPGDELMRTFYCSFIEAFSKPEEYWIEEQVSPCNLIKTSIIFPIERPPIFWEARLLRGWYNEFNCVQPTCHIVRGRTRLEFEVRNEKVNDRFRIKWKW